jgi:hypothetical protein
MNFWSESTKICLLIPLATCSPPRTTNFKLSNTNTNKLKNLSPFSTCASKSSTSTVAHGDIYSRPCWYPAQRGTKRFKVARPVWSGRKSTQVRIFVSTVGKTMNSRLSTDSLFPSTPRITKNNPTKKPTKISKQSSLLHSFQESKTTHFFIATNTQNIRSNRKQ